MISLELLQLLALGEITNYQRLAGGDVNLAYRLDSQEGPYFLLLQPGRTADFYAAEVAGLLAMAEAGVRVPAYIKHGDHKGCAYLLLEYLAEAPSGNQRLLGQELAKLHHYQSDLFGFDLPYQGSTMSFSNDWTDNWAQLFLNQRLDPLADKIINLGGWDQDQVNHYLKVRQIIASSLDQHKSQPSLLHGDLWSGNFMFLQDGGVAFFDPAPLYGDREFDIGITTVFAGFNTDFYQAYQESYPLVEGYEFRLHFYRLYFLMLHQAKFGATYASSVERELSTILQGA